jgi:hypothetical protein
MHGELHSAELRAHTLAVFVLLAARSGTGAAGAAAAGTAAAATAAAGAAAAGALGSGSTGAICGSTGASPGPSSTAIPACSSSSSNSSVVTW